MTRIVDLDSLTDSRILYEKRPPLFGLLLLALTAGAIVAVVLWSSVTMRPSLIEGVGVIEGANRTVVMASVSGRIAAVDAPNGSRVEAGARVVAVESLELQAEKDTVAAQKALLEKELDLQSRFSQAVRDGENSFRQDVADEAAFYWQFDSLQKQKDQLIVSRESLEALGYTPVEIDGAIADNALKAEELDSTALSESSAEETQIRQQIAEIDIRGRAASTGESAFQITAPVSGTVHLDEGVQVGSVVTAGDRIGSVASTEEGLDVSVYLSVPDRQHVEVGDRATVSVEGLPAVEYEKLSGRVVSIDADVTAMPIDGTETANYFVVHLALDDDVVRTRDGAEHDLINGTTITVDLVRDEVTYLEYAQELAGFSP
ncbi:HlyD family efflux transporter periplasmic adaptor subunit [Labedella populi]|uniref:HlyD family efflux transporter periplasmic adaptor subunit n=1 Tax=Labedella populi TaxID=2498850 RepID=A0A3S4AFU6_9MICO|nr:HlyD family efflux transporter periplasmic adaptor subunit [Labedella populi]RWZ67777.1 HlyD family efflux transporter periplasmic adaptor subunit [Labedella populi]